jgi:hypothetical protein
VGFLWWEEAGVGDRLPASLEQDRYGAAAALVNGGASVGCEPRLREPVSSRKVAGAMLLLAALGWRRRQSRGFAPVLCV